MKDKKKIPGNEPFVMSHEGVDTSHPIILCGLFTWCTRVEDLNMRVASSCSHLPWSQRSRRPLAVGLFALCWQPADTAKTSDASRLYLAGSVPLVYRKKRCGWFVPRQHSAKRKEKKLCPNVSSSSHEFIGKATWEETLPLVQNKG